MSSEKQLKLPNFVVAGAAKSGSTSLYEYIKKHPEIFLPERKESRYFASEKLKNTLGYNKTSVFDWEEFCEPYYGVNDKQKAIGDFGNLYMIFPDLAISNIKKRLGTEVKIVFIIRNPIKRAYSAYQMGRRNFYEDQSFENGLQLESQRLEEGYVPCDIVAYKKMGLYANPIAAFKKHFEVYTMVLEELKGNPEAELAKLYNFLGVSDSFKSEVSSAHNKGGQMPTASVNVFKMQRFLKSLKPVFGFIPGLSKLSEWFIKTTAKNLATKTAQEAETLSADMATRLYQIFREDVAKTSGLIGKDLEAIWNFSKYKG